MDKPLAARIGHSAFTIRRGRSLIVRRDAMNQPCELLPLALRRVLLAITYCLSVITLSAQSNFITLDNYTVHPTRILAKFKDGALSTWSTEAANQIGSR